MRHPFPIMFSAVALASACACAVADEVGASFTTSALLSQKRIIPFEPLYVAATLRNVSAEPQAHRACVLPTNQIRFGDRGRWESSGDSLDSNLGCSWAEPKFFQPGESLASVICVHVQMGGRHVFQRPGTYWIKAGFEEANGIKLIPLEVAPAGEEEAAASYLAEHLSIHWSFTEESAKELLRTIKDWDEKQSGKMADYKISDPRSELPQFIARFPGSRYAQWAKLGLLIIRKVEGALDPAVMQNMRAKMREDGGAAVAQLDAKLRALEMEVAALAREATHPPVKALSFYYAGTVATMRRDEAGAEAHFGDAVAAQGSAIMAEQIGHFRRLAQQGAIVQTPLPRPRPEDWFEDAKRRLAARRYDVRGFPKDSPEGYKEWQRADHEILALRRRGIIPEAEMYRRWGRQLEFIVMKHAKPLSPVEWERRQAIYAAEDAERRRD